MCRKPSEGGNTATQHSHACVKWLAGVPIIVVANVVVHTSMNMAKATRFGWGVAMFSEMCMCPSRWLTAGQSNRFAPVK